MLVDGLLIFRFKVTLLWRSSNIILGYKGRKIEGYPIIFVAKEGALGSEADYLNVVKNK